MISIAQECCKLQLMEYLAFSLSPEYLITSGGLVAVALIIFAESGLLVGFFLPGDTLLLSAGFLASQGKLSLATLLVVVVVFAILGDNVGYSIGRRAGPRIFKKRDGVVFRQEYLARSEKFYEKHGGKTIILARFIPIVRTFAPVVAGASKMDRKKFMAYNVVGATLWGVGVTTLGYWLGSKVPNIDKYLLPAFLGVTVLTFGPAIYHLLKDKNTRLKLATGFNKLTRKVSKLIGLNRNIDL